MKGILAMSQKELDRLQIIKQIEKKELQVDENCLSIRDSSKV